MEREAHLGQDVERFLVRSFCLGRGHARWSWKMLSTYKFTLLMLCSVRSRHCVRAPTPCHTYSEGRKPNGRHAQVYKVLGTFLLMVDEIDEQALELRVEGDKLERVLHVRRPH